MFAKIFALLWILSSSPALAVFGGAVPEKGKDLPYIGALLMDTNAKDQVLQGPCSLSMVCPTVALTAEHCIAHRTPEFIRTKMKVTLDRGNPDPVSFTKTDKAKAIEDFHYENVKRYAFHPEGFHVHDGLALLKLRESFDPKMRYAQLPEKDKEQHPGRGDALPVAGYGWSEDATRASNVRGTLRFGVMGFWNHLTSFPSRVSEQPDDAFILEMNAEGQSGCPGDSGSPLLVSDKLYGVLALVSNQRCQRPERSRPPHINLYISLLPNRDWIMRKMRDWCPK